MKSFIVSFFTAVLLGYLILPSLISLIDDGKEVAIYIDLNEEEENKEEATKDFEIKINTLENKPSFSEKIYLKRKKTNVSFHNYASKYLEVNTPPPKQLF
ncbi:hypothetical protein BW723_05975 [Polaribacter reichenbachii]|uniref:Uncharacterized protein n=1 Tax=Polaribacter reichenbachii TaxID=996801 RepID=A0A1B8TYK4_9FLAO|nr:hypothetical protein [Polaribacter reichenbachii]APZ45869.1 hypothetical protein BW723_05975 [Polaribacter reichenbachii]AUC19731.1 hypothetical protein BTO17_13990 [Polaribacter reichenbachii]OBY64698.1 hypothetical protein LPB301_09745 [Polaribacter reichenbachii]